MRTSLHASLKKAEAPGEWTHVLEQIGMFSYTGLTPKQVSQHRHLAQCSERLISCLHRAMYLPVDNSPITCFLLP